MSGPVLTRARALLAAAVAALAAGCYVTPRNEPAPNTTSTGGSGGASGSGGSAGGQAGTGGGSGSAGSAGGQAGTGGGAGSGGSATGLAGSGGLGGSSTPVFVRGPCIASADRVGVEVFARSSDGRILRRASDGSTWGDWNNLAGLDGTLIDARSDLDCSGYGPTTHIVATGVNPVGSLLHAFGSETTYNPFVRELGNASVEPSPSIAVAIGASYFLAALGIGNTFPAVYELGAGPTPRALTPITSLVDSIRSGPDLALQSLGGSAIRYFVAFDSNGDLAIYFHVETSSDSHWESPVKMSPPLGAFAFSPAICTENGAFGIASVNIVAAAGGQLWYRRSPSITSPFSSWTSILTAPGSSPDCAVTGPESTVHVVTTSAAGSVIATIGKDTAWVVSDLGNPR